MFCFLQTIATASMFLASKAEETPRWLSDLVVVAYKLANKWDPFAPQRIRQRVWQHCLSFSVLVFLSYLISGESLS